MPARVTRVLSGPDSLAELARDGEADIVVCAVVGSAGLPAALAAAEAGKTIALATKEALASVPKAFREACWNLGASRWQVIRTIVLPNSISGILTGLILEVCRAAGETAPIMFTGAILYKAVTPGDLLPYAPTDTAMALSYHLWAMATMVRNMPESMLYATAVVLVGFGAFPPALLFLAFGVAAWRFHWFRRAP